MLRPVPGHGCVLLNSTAAFAASDFRTRVAEQGYFEALSEKLLARCCMCLMRSDCR